MLKITPYLGILVIITSIAGLWYPLLGYILPIVMITLFITSLSKGRWFCGNLCPRGSLMDFWVSKIAGKKKIPKVLKSYAIRVPLLAFMMVFMGYRLISTQGLINQIGMVFVVMCLATTAIALVLGVSIAPRTWCTFCPMGTMQKMLGGHKHKLHVDNAKCIECRKCEKSCVMHLPILKSTHDSDCIKCGRCVDVCPKDALKF